MCSFALRASIAALVALSAPAVTAQDTPIAGARLRVIEKNTGGLSVTIENLRDAPLVAWKSASSDPARIGPARC
jgi:hypothetical protein